MEDFKKHLAKDAKFKKILNNEIVLPEIKRNMSMWLVTSILSQQLSTKVAKVMHERFIELFNGKEPKPEEILNVSVEKIRSIGISQNKANYIHNVAQFVVENKITDKKLQKLSDEEVIELLTQIKGVGRWTAQMLLIFALGREDIFAVDDLGIQKAVQQMHKLDHLSVKELKAKMLEVSERWSPFRSYACLYLWASVSPK